MTLFNLKKTDRIAVKVLEKRQFSNKSIYEVEYSGRKFQVPMFEFQKQLPKPETMECVVQSVDENSLFLQQNIVALLRENYKIGETYEFTVAQDYTTTSTPHYKLTDGTGFFFKLYPEPGMKFAKNRKIRCRIRKIKGVEVDLEYVGLVHEMNAIFNIPSLIEKIGRDARMLIAHFVRRSEMADVADLYESGSPEWLPAAIETVIADLARTPLYEVTTQRKALLDCLGRTVVWFLEDSDYFDKFPEADRYQWQGRFGRALRNIEALRAAYDILLGGTQQTFIDSIVKKFKASGYLIDADHKLLTLKSVLAIDPSGLNNVIDELLTVVADRRTDCLRLDTFRRAFIDLFQLYVESNSHTLDEMDEAETQEAKNALHTMVRVLATQLLLATRENDTADAADASGIDFELNRSRLYRYLTLRNNGGDFDLIEKSLLALLACERWHTEYTWNDVTEVIKLSTRLRQPAKVATLPALYETPAAALKVSESLIEVDDNAGDASVEVFPTAGLRLWHGMKVNLSAQLPANIRDPRTILQYRHFWQEVERRLGHGAAGEAPDAAEAKFDLREVPQRKQEVEIEIYAADPDNRERYLCRVVEFGLRGEGWIEKREITTSNQDLPASVFIGTDGKPLVFKATVINARSENALEFSLTDTLNDYFNSIINYNDIDDCVILRKLGDSCTVLSRRGFTLNVELDADHDYLETGDVIRVGNININGNWREGEFFSEISGRIDFLTVFREMLLDFALIDNPDDSEDEDEAREEGGALQEANRMDASAVAELIRIIESVASKERENRLAYNYYAYARLLARMIDDSQLAAYFDKRCQLLEEFDDFSTNGRVNLDHINSLMSGLMTGNNSLTNDGEKLRILAVLDHPENNSYLWNLFSTNASESLQELARLVLAYNMLDGFKMREQRLEIRHKLYSKLKINIEKEPAVIAGGLEGLTTEFKTSIAYPANSMRLDVAAQTQVILKVITSFLNTEGGTLYIGVSDEGYVRGLETDLAYFRSKDNFDRHVHDNIRKHLTYIPNIHHYIETGWIENGGKEIYVVKVKPVFEPIELSGVYYYREGSSCVMVKPENEEQFIKSRLALAPADTAVKSAATYGAQRQAAAAAAQRQAGLLDLAASQPVVSAPVAPVADYGHIATSEMRNNVLHEGYEGYDNVSDYLYIFADGRFDIDQTDRWQEGSCALALGIHPSERDGALAVISADGYAYRLQIASLADSDRALSAKTKPRFISPVADDDKLIMIYRDSDGTAFKRLFNVSDLKMMRPGERGEVLDREIDEVLFCEVVSPEAQSAFKVLQRKQRIGRDGVDRERMAIIERLRRH